MLDSCIPSIIVASPITSNTEATMATKTAESATDVSTVNKDSVELSKPTKLLSGLVAYGDDSDSDVDT